MKKAFKIALAAVMIISMMTLFASAQEKSIELCYDEEYSETETYYYGGELKNGNNKVRPLADVDEIIFGDHYDDYVYYEFDVEQSGYYDFEAVSDAYYSIYISQDVRNGVVYGDTEVMFMDDKGFSVYLEEGSCIVGLIFYFYDWNGLGDVYNSGLNIEFLGAEITDMQIEEEYLEDLILGYHIGNEYDEENICGIYAEGKLVFDSGKECEFGESFAVEYPEDIAPGENAVTFTLPGYSKEYTVQIKTVDDYIKSVEVGNADRVAVVRQTFVPFIAYPSETDSIELIITKPDGTKQTEAVGWHYDIELKGEKTLTVWCDYCQKDDGNWYLTVQAAEKEFLAVPCETVSASFGENISLYWEGVLEYSLIMIDDVMYYLPDALNVFSGLNSEDRMIYFSNVFSAVGDCCGEIYSLTEMFFDYVF